MLRIEFNNGDARGVRVRLEGRLVGSHAEDARVTLSRQPSPGSMLVDLTEVTFVDPLGEQVLLWLSRFGAKFVAVNVYTRAVCERLQLQLSEPQGAQSP